MKRTVGFGLFFIILMIAGWVGYNYYGFLFARTVDGEIRAVERVMQSSAIITSANSIPASQLYSFAVAIREHGGGEIVTGSSEDRQWAVVQQGQCAEAKFFPYAPWILEKAGTYYGVRLMRLYDCPGKTAPQPIATPATVASPTPSASVTSAASAQVPVSSPSNSAAPRN